MRTRTTQLALNTGPPAVLEVQGGSPLHSTSGSHPYVKSITDVGGGGREFRACIASGDVLPFKPVDISTGGYQFIRPMSFTQVEPNLGPSPTVWGSYYYNWSLTLEPNSIIDDPAAIAYVTNAAIARSKSQTYDALTSIAEMGKTANLVRNRMSSVFDIAQKAAYVAQRRGRDRASRFTGKSGSTRRANIREDAAAIAQRVRDFNNLWLEARYGWRPLIKEIDDAVTFLKESRRAYNKGTARVDVPLNQSLTGTVASNASQRWVARTSIAGTRTYRGFGLAVGDFGSVPQFQPITTAWELVPYSWVVDWFFDIGSAFQAATPLPGMDIRASGYSITDSYELNRELYQEAIPGASYPVIITMGQTQQRLGLFSRYRRVQSDAVLPRFYPRLTTLRTVDLVALVAQRSFRLGRTLYRE